MNYIHSTALIGENVELGDNIVIGAYSVIGVEGFHRDSDGITTTGKVTIGDGTRIGTHCTINVGNVNATVIGKDCKLMNYVNIGHDATIGDKCTIGAHTVIPGKCKVEDYVNIGINSTIHQRIKIGEGAMVGMGSVVTKDVKSWGKVYGNPARHNGWNTTGASRHNKLEELNNEISRDLDGI